MKYASIITILCYCFSEIYKFVFINKQEMMKLIPIFSTLLGGLLGILIWLTSKNIIFENIWLAFEMGMISGAGATGANQIIKQLFQAKKVER